MKKTTTDASSVLAEHRVQRSQQLAQSGYTLSYQGARYSPASLTEQQIIENAHIENSTSTPLQIFANRFSNLGALAIRLAPLQKFPLPILK